MPSPLAEKLPAALRGRLGLALAALAGLALATAISVYLHREEARNIRQEIDRRVTLRHDLLRQNLREYDSALYALRVLVENSTDLDPEEFARAATATLGRIDGIQAVQWVPVVRAEEVPAFVERMRPLAGHGYALHERLADGSLALVPPASPRLEFAPVAYVHPLAGNERSLGYDVFTALTAPQLEAARAEPGKIVLSRPIHLIQGGEGVVFLAYVDRPDMAAHPAPFGGPGFVQIVFRLDAMMRKAWSTAPYPILDVMLVDATEEPVHLFSEINGVVINPSLAAPPADFVRDARSARDLPIAGRLWRVHYRPRAEWLASRHSLAPALSFVGTLLLTAVSVAYLRTLLRQTERIRDEVRERTAQLAESRALLDEITDHNPGAIWVKDTSFRYQLVNPRFASYHGGDRSAILGRTDSAFHPPEIAAEMEARDAEVLATGRTLDFEQSYPIGGATRTFLVTKFPLRRADGSIYAVAGVATEITPLREAEAARRAAERKLLETQKLESLAVLAGGVAHDFNNLLTGILGHASLARAHLAPTHHVQDFLAQIETASHRAAELCRQMLAYSGRGRIAVQPVELGELVRDTVGVLKLSLARRARLHFDLAPGLPVVIADLVQLRQIAMNLVLNASEALPDGDGDITLRTRLVRADAALFAACVFSPELPAGDYVCLEVSDTGHGMSPETLARIFDPFFSTKFTGRGLGLAAVLGIVRGHGGALRVESRPGFGTCFRLYLPVAPAEQLAPRSPAADAPAPPPAPAGLHLLLVDDESAVRDTVVPLLKACGHTVAAFADGESALAGFLAEPGSYQAALLDLTMPGLGGVQLLRRLREARPDLPVLLISGYSEPDASTADALRSPRVAFLAKPFALAALRDRLAELASPAA